jgi:hypothetical protein
MKSYEIYRENKKQSEQLASFLWPRSKYFWNAGLQPRQVVDIQHRLKFSLQPALIWNSVNDFFDNVLILKLVM